MEKMLKLIVTWFISLGLFFCFIDVARAERPYFNFPSHAKVKVSREPNGQSWIYLEFKWSKGCPPNFGQNRAVEFEVNIRPKCFLRPPGGKDNITDCDARMGEKKYALPGGSTNCYVDVLNYWIPSEYQIVPIIESSCGDLDFLGEQCAKNYIVSGGAADQSGNFAVGVYDASKFKADELYSIRYPVEINNSPECQNLTLYINNIGSHCFAPLLGDTVRNDWGRAWITMQSFNNSCDLPCDLGSKTYTCPELIGASVPKAFGDIGCVNANKYTDFWMNRMCVPTEDFIFVPGIELHKDYAQSNVCLSEKTSIDLGTHGICCLDRDGDKYFANQSFVTYGTRVGDCKDSDKKINPAALEVCDDGVDNDCKGGDCQDMTCSPGYVYCNGSCTDLATDSLNCGECGNVCQSSAPFCVNADCLPCTLGQLSNCGGVCVDLDTDEQHCGSCETACDPGEICVGGLCQSP